MADVMLPLRLKSSLLDETRRLMLNRPRHLTIPMIAEATGLKASWLNGFSACKDDDAEFGVNKIQTLYEYLAGKSLL